MYPQNVNDFFSESYMSHICFVCFSIINIHIILLVTFGIQKAFHISSAAGLCSTKNIFNVRFSKVFYLSNRKLCYSSCDNCGTRKVPVMVITAIKMATTMLTAMYAKHFKAPIIEQCFH